MNAWTSILAASRVSDLSHMCNYMCNYVNYMCNYVGTKMNGIIKHHRLAGADAGVRLLPTFFTLFSSKYI